MSLESDLDEAGQTVSTIFLFCLTCLLCWTMGGSNWLASVGPGFSSCLSHYRSHGGGIHLRPKKPAGCCCGGAATNAQCYAGRHIISIVPCSSFLSPSPSYHTPHTVMFSTLKRAHQSGSGRANGGDGGVDGRKATRRRGIKFRGNKQMELNLYANLKNKRHPSPDRERRKCPLYSSLTPWPMISVAGSSYPRGAMVVGFRWVV